MKIEVVGHKGVVGNATYELFKRLGYEVKGSDKGEQIRKADVYFICVPEDNIEELISALTNYANGLIVIRSTVVPGTCKRLSEKYSRHICHNPEFAREATAIQDELNPSRIVIGECCQKHGDLLEKIYGLLQRPIVRTDPATSELVKLASNNYLSCVISYWNTIEEIAKRIGVSGHRVGMIASLDPRISDYGSRFHNKYGGRCLPKDIGQLIAFAQSIGYDPILLKAVEEVNKTL
ncbi:MAG: NAD(P)-binding domain-containing protein [Candidatus Bathyarchaeota archaeon]